MVFLTKKRISGTFLVCVVLNFAFFHDDGSKELSARTLAAEENEEKETIRKLGLMNIQSSDYYTELFSDDGNGECLSASGARYDFTAYTDVGSAETCAVKCNKHLLKEEHRGFGFGADSQNCKCYFDDKMLSTRLRQKNTVDESRSGVGSISATQNDTNSEYRCYKKNTAALGNPIDAYNEDLCSNQDNTLDFFSFDLDEDQNTLNECANKCLRFKLLFTHTGFAYYPNGQCDCYFVSGEAPRSEVMPDGITIQRKMSRNARKAVGEELATCYVKKAAVASTNTHAVYDNTEPSIWINEFHYRNGGTDAPFIELVGPAMDPVDASKQFEPTGYEIVFYQARDGGLFKDPIALANLRFDQNIENGWGFMVLDLDANQMRNGKQGGDGIALVKFGKCLQFISYTDTGVVLPFDAAAGVCNGIASTSIPVFESRETSVDHSLQLAGEGSDYTAFTWEGPITNTKGARNTGQTFGTIPLVV